MSFMAQFTVRENVSNTEPWMNMIADDAVLIFPGLPHLEGKQGIDADLPALDILWIFMNIYCMHIQ